MNKNPKIKLELSIIDKILEIAGWSALLTLWFIILINYSDLPDKIPSHYNAYGEVDGYGSKFLLIILTLISTILYISLTYLNRFPHIFNFPVKITQENAVNQYIIATRLIRYIKFIIVLIFGSIVFITIFNYKNSNIGIGIWFLPIILILVFLPLIYFIRKSIKNK